MRPDPVRPAATAVFFTLALLLALAGSPGALAGTPALDAATARAELRYAADTALAVHPVLTTEGARTAFEGELARQESRLGDAPTRQDVALALQLLLASLGDAHTTSAPQSAATDQLPVAFFATTDAILVSPVEGLGVPLPDVGILVRLGDLTPDALLGRMAGLIPGALPWVRYRTGQLLATGPVLAWLGVLRQGRVEITVRAPDGTTTTHAVHLVQRSQLRGRSAPLGPRLQRAAGLGQDWTARGQTFLWRIDEASHTGLFWLLSCVDSEAYRGAVEAFFEAVQRDGGLLGMRRASSVIRVPPAPPVFTGDVVVLTNGAAFSSAGMVAVLLSDNGLARVAGEPVGADAGGYGDILTFHTPGLELPFTVSTKRFRRPSRDAVSPSRLPVDLPLPLTAADVIQGRDVLAAWLQATAP
ncbi:MAG: S41 family peptidase [Deinococcales bacterium]